METQATPQGDSTQLHTTLTGVALQSVAGRMIEMLSRQPIPLADLSNVASGDPAITSALFRAAAMETDNPAESLDAAVVLLGYEGVERVLAGVKVSCEGTRDHPAVLRSVLHAQLCAYLTRGMAAQCGQRVLHHAYLAGLLHELPISAAEFLPEAVAYPLTCWRDDMPFPPFFLARAIAAAHTFAIAVGVGADIRETHAAADPLGLVRSHLFLLDPERQAGVACRMMVDFRRWLDETGVPTDVTLSPGTMARVHL